MVRKEKRPFKTWSYRTHRAVRDGMGAGGEWKNVSSPVFPARPDIPNENKTLL